MANNNMEIYEKLQTPPNDAMKSIGFGSLKGFSDINPQWRYEALTSVFGTCGIGWRFEIVDRFIQPVPSGELMVFVQVNLYIMDSESGQWSAPIPGWGGDYLIKKDKNGIHGNDEAMKMATTDALGTAAKMIGVAADVYRGLIANGASDSKYARRDYMAKTSQNRPQAAQKQNAGTTKGGMDEMRKNAMEELKAAMYRTGMTGQEVGALAGVKLGKTSTREMTTEEINQLANNLADWIEEQGHE